MNNEELEQLSPEEARDILWQNGDAWQFLLDPLQQKLVRSYLQSDIGKELILVLGRQVGKSYALFTLAMCECLRRPGITVVYVAPTLKMAKKITRMTLREVAKTAPKDCTPKFNTQDSEYNFPNGSKIELAGFNAGQIEDSRGPKAHLIIVDECGFMDASEFDYGVNSVLYPKLNSTRGVMLMCSTLPKSAAHPYWNRVLKAKLEDRLVEGTVYDCPRYTKDDIDKFASRSGGYESIDFRREFMNEMVTDEEKAVVPEATKNIMNKIVREVTRPSHFDCYIGMDIGFRDYTAILFAYYDFLKNTVVIEDEVIIKGTRVTTKAIADAIKEKEEKLWQHKKPFLRIADNNNLILLNELTQSPYNLPIFPTAKDNREAAINKVRLLIQKEQIIINPRCVVLQQHLQHATWNNKRSEFERDPLNGHFDALAALIYLCRNVQYQRNPYPPEYMMTTDAFYVDMSNGFDAPKDDFQKHIREAFNPFKKKTF
jgi:hypothetical protein